METPSFEKKTKTESREEKQSSVLESGRKKYEQKDISPIEDKEAELELQKLRKEMKKSEETEAEETMDLLKSLRLKKNVDRTPVIINAEDKKLIEEAAAEKAELLKKNYRAGFGVFPTSDPKENFYEQIWTRDFAHAAGNYFATKNPEAVYDSLETIFKNQREDGALPYKTEKRYALLQLIPKIGPMISKPLFDMIGKLKGRKEEQPLYENESFSGAEDTIPASIISAGEFFINSGKGREFAEKHFDQFKKAIDFFRKKTDKEDGLARTKNANPDWADSLYRKGKLGTINVWWARSLRLMEFMAKQLGKEEDAENYRNEFRKVKKSVTEKIYNKEEGYFRAKEGDDRIDTAASVFGALYFSSPAEAVKIEETLKKRVKHSSGLKNFDPPYPPKEIFLVHRAIGNAGYHNEFVWPWITCQNIQVKIKIALGHPDETIRKQYKKEAVEDLVEISELFKKAGGAYEIFKPDEPVAAKTRFYTPPQNLMGNMAAYEGAYLQLKELGWI